MHGILFCFSLIRLEYPSAPRPAPLTHERILPPPPPPRSPAPVAMEKSSKKQSLIGFGDGRTSFVIHGRIFAPLPPAPPP